MSTPRSICRLRYLWARSPQHSRRNDGVPLRICRSVWSSSPFFKLTRLEPLLKAPTPTGRRLRESVARAARHAPRHAEFVAECKKAVVELYGPDPRSNLDFSRIISAAAVKRIGGL